MSTDLTPTEVAQKALADAEQKAWMADWKQYLKQEEKHRRHRFGIKTYKNHGKYSTYTNGCRCDDCRSSWADYMRERNRKLRELYPKPERPTPKGREGRTVKEHQHGTLTGYVYGCRCRDCTEAHRVSKPKSSIKHGTEYGYKRGCRCRSCKRASREARCRRAGKEPTYRYNKPTPKHGTRNRYDRGCRCLKCKEVMREYFREYRRRKKNNES